MDPKGSQELIKGV